MRHSGRLLAALILLVSTSGQVLAQAGPKALGDGFCAARMSGDEAKTRALLSPALQKLVAEAEARNAVIAKAAPDEKPPFGDGIPYQAFQDRAPACAAGPAKVFGGRTVVEVSYAFPEQANANWTDRLLIVETPEGFRIDDILFATFTTDSTEFGLRRILFEAFDP